VRADQLIGKLAVRTKCATQTGDRSFTDKPILIIGACDSHIKYCNPDWPQGGGRLLGDNFADDNWISYSCLMFLLSPARSRAVNLS